MGGEESSNDYLEEGVGFAAVSTRLWSKVWMDKKKGLPSSILWKLVRERIVMVSRARRASKFT